MLNTHARAKEALQKKNIPDILWPQQQWNRIICKGCFVIIAVDTTWKRSYPHDFCMFQCPRFFFRCSSDTMFIVSNVVMRPKFSSDFLYMQPLIGESVGTEVKRFNHMVRKSNFWHAISEFLFPVHLSFRFWPPYTATVRGIIFADESLLSAGIHLMTAD